MKVAVVCMPFYSILRPSIQIGILTSCLRENGIDATSMHLNLEFSRFFESSTEYESICKHRGTLVGEWLFAKTAFGQSTPNDHDLLLEEYGSEIEQELSELNWQNTLSELRRIRDQVIPRYFEHVLSSISWESFDVVGFSSTFQQNTASFALARLLKERYPGLKTVFGGSNFDGEMGFEYLNQIDSIDYIVKGRGESSFVDLIRAIEKEADTDQIVGVYRKNSNKPLNQISKEPKLDVVPIPDYEEFFDRATKVGLIRNEYHKRRIRIPFESSKGCWWGEKNHCTFCGLNAETMNFTSKHPSKVVDELEYQSEKYSSFTFEAVDNIMDYGYLNQLIPTLVERENDFRIFYEIKSNLKREQIRSMKLSGIDQVQPGIESLSTHTLKLMKKGVSGLQNVNFLKWATYYDIKVYWNVLWGFPGEKKEDIEAQTEKFKHLSHLQPPFHYGRIWMERFSPVYFDTSKFHHKYLKPQYTYHYIYPESFNLDKIAYFFDYELEGTLKDEEYANFVEALNEWQNNFENNTNQFPLVYSYSSGIVQIEEFRLNKRHGVYTFKKPVDQLFQLCSNQPVSYHTIQKQTEIDDETLKGYLEDLVELGLFMQEDEFYLNLCLPKTRGR